MNQKLIYELESLIQATITKIETFPLPLSRWEDFAEFVMDQPVGWSSDSLMDSGDNVPSLDDGEWRQYLYELKLSRDKDGMTIEAMSFDGDDWETEGEFSSKEEWEESLESRVDNCYWTLLHQELYDLYCIETGTDPLGNIMTKSEVYSIKGKVTYTPDSVDAGREELLSRAADWNAISKIISGGTTSKECETPRHGNVTCLGWDLVSQTPEKIVIDMEVRGIREVPNTDKRIREVAARSYSGTKEESIRDLCQKAENLMHDARVSALEEQGMTRSDAQGVIDAEDM